MFKLLSYRLDSKTPTFGDTAGLEIKYPKSIAQGKSCNTAQVSFSNHLGTHIDCPNHFHAEGKKISDYDIEEFIFDSPLVIDCQKKENELIMPEDLKGIKDCDLLLIRTGFSRYRALNKYKDSNPGISHLTAKYIREKYPNIRGVGMDFISLTANNHRDEGRKAHRVLLDHKNCKNRPPLIIEDMNLNFEKEKLKKVFAIPVFVENVDSMVCTVIGEFY